MESRFTQFMIKSTLTGMHGVGEVCIEKEGQEQRLSVEHDPTTVTAEELMRVFKDLPSFYEGFFIPTLIGNAERQD